MIQTALQVYGHEYSIRKGGEPFPPFNYFYRTSVEHILAILLLSPNIKSSPLFIFHITKYAIPVIV
jgi:hypothetical protein